MRRHLPVILLLALTAPLCAAPSPVRQVGLIVDPSGIPSPAAFARFVDVMVETLSGSRQWEPTVLTEECPLIRASGAPWPDGKSGWAGTTDTLRAVLVATRLSDVLVIIPVPAAINTVEVVWVQADKAEARQLQFMTAGAGDSSYAALTNQLIARLNGGFEAAAETPVRPAQPATPAAPTAPVTVVATAGAPTPSAVGHETPATTTPKAQPGTTLGNALLTKPELTAALPVAQPVRPVTPTPQAAQPAPEPLKPETPATTATVPAALQTPAAPVTPAATAAPTATPTAAPTVTAPVVQPTVVALAPPAVTTPQPAATPAKPEPPAAIQPAATPVKTEAPPAVAVVPTAAAPTAEAAVVPLAGGKTGPAAATQPAPATGATRPEAQPLKPEAAVALSPPATAPATTAPPPPAVVTAPVLPVAPTAQPAQPAPPTAQLKATPQFLAAAEKALADGDFRKVEDMLLRATDADEPKAEVFYLYARLEAARQDPAAERTWLQRTVGQDPGNLPAHLRLAELLRGAGLWRKAVDEFNLVLKADPDSVQAYLGLATVYAGQAQPRKAAEIVAEAVKHAPADASLYLRLGDLQAQRKALAEAESAYDKAARLSQGTTRADALDRLGDLYVGAQRDHEGFICYAEAAALRSTGSSALAEKRYRQIMAAADQSLRRSLQQAAEALQGYLTGREVTREEAFAAMSDFNNRAQEVSKFAESIAPPGSLKLQHAERKLAFSLASEAALYGLLYLDQARPADLELYQTRLTDSVRGLQALPLPGGPN